MPKPEWYERTQTVYTEKLLSRGMLGNVLIIQARTVRCINLQPPAAVIAADVAAEWGDQAASEDYFSPGECQLGEGIMCNDFDLSCQGHCKHG